MAKGKAGVLEAAAQYVKNKLPQTGFFSTLDELIANAPFEKAPLEQWRNYLQPGRVFEREGVRFPLKKEEIDYSGLNKPIMDDELGFPLGKDQLRQILQDRRPEFSLKIGAEYHNDKAPEVVARSLYPDEVKLYEENQGLLGYRPPPMMVSHRYADYAHPTWPGGYEESMTNSGAFGSFPTHFGPENISHSRTTLQPTTDQKLMRLVEEIQSDRHQAAAKRLPIDREEELSPKSSDEFTGPRRGYQNPEREKELRSQMLELNNAPEMLLPSDSPEFERFVEQRYRGPADELDRLKKAIPDAPFKDPADYSMLELKNQLLNAVKRNQDYLGMVRGADVSRRFGHTMDQAVGTQYTYDKVYQSQLDKLARQYGIEKVEVPTKLVQSADVATPTMRGLETESINDFMDMMHSHIEDTFGEGNEIPKYLDELITELKNGTGLNQMAGEARRKLTYARKQVLEPNGVDRKQFKRAWLELGNILNDMHLTYAAELRKNQPDVQKTFPALNLTPEVREKILKAGIPIWALGATGAVGSMMQGDGDTSDGDGYAEGGEVKEESIATRLGNLARKFGFGPKGMTKEAQDNRARLVAGLLSQWLGENSKEAGGPEGFFSIGKGGLFEIDPATGETKVGWRPGLVDETLAIPTIMELFGGEAPAWSKEAAARTERLHELTRRQMGLGEPHGFDENATESLGMMLGQLPIPAAKAREAGARAAPILREVRQAAETTASSPLEFLLPTINPRQPENYLSGAIAGGLLGELQDRLNANAEDSPPPVKRAEGGEVKESVKPLREMFEQLRERFNQLSGGFNAFEEQ